MTIKQSRKIIITLISGFFLALTPACNIALSLRVSFLCENLNANIHFKCRQLKILWVQQKQLNTHGNDEPD